MTDPVWISHRGLHHDCVENTAAAFDAAVEAGFDQIETDLHCTRDGHIVLHHDADMQRTAGSAASIGDISLREFLATPLRDGQRGLSFEQFAERYQTLPWILDIKPESANATLNALAHWAERQRSRVWLLAQARFLVWRPDDEHLLQQLLPGAITMASAGECRRAGLATLCGLEPLAGLRPGRTYSLPPRALGLPLLTPGMVQRYHRNGARLLAFLPATPAEVQAALDAGCDELLVECAPLRQPPAHQP